MWKPIPSLRATQKIIYDWENPKTPEEKEAREQLNELEQPWNLATIVKHPIPPEAIPKILAMQCESKEPLTIREALWVGRLYQLAEQQAGGILKDLTLLQRLGDFSRLYAWWERASEFTGDHHDTSALDLFFYTGDPVDEEIWGGMVIVAFPDLYELLRGKIEEAQNEGNIRKKGERSWQITIDVGSGPDGKRKRYFETVHSTRKRDAQKRLSELLVSFEKGVYTPYRRGAPSQLAGRVCQD